MFTLVGDVNSAIAGKEPTAADVPALIAARDSIAELMGVFGIDVAAATAEGDAYPAEVVDLAAELAGYAGGNATEAVEALVALRAEARASKAWQRSASRSRTRRKALRWKWRSAQACFRRAEE